MYLKYSISHTAPVFWSKIPKEPAGCLTWRGAVPLVNLLQPAAGSTEGAVIGTESSNQLFTALLWGDKTPSKRKAILFPLCQSRPARGHLRKELYETPHVQQREALGQKALALPCLNGQKKPGATEFLATDLYICLF